MNKLLIILTLLVLGSPLSAEPTKDVSAGYNSEGDKVYLSMPLTLSILISLRGGSPEFVAENWLSNCAPSNIFKGTINRVEKVDDSARKLFINYKWKSFGRGKSEMLIIFGDSRFRVRCLDADA